MKIYKTIPVPATTREHLDKIICDICKKESPYGPNWTKEYARTLDTTIEFEDSYNYGNDGGHGEKLNFDICTECFKEKLIPFFKQFGAEPTRKEIDY